MSAEKRSFTVISVETTTGRVKGSANLGGRFMSKTPSGAARKAASRICRESSIKGQCTLIVVVQETTQGSAHKSYKYKVKRIRDPVTIKYKGGLEITREYRTEIKSMN
jgi:hypothetical protein